MTDQTETVHEAPPLDEGVTPCCGRTPFELPPTDRMTTDPGAVTCRAALRDRIAKALADEDARTCGWGHGFLERYGADAETDGFVDAVLGVLAPPADRGAVLREAAELVTGFAADHFPDEYDEYSDRLADELRRVADETPATEAHPPHDSWLVEWRAEGADWAVAYPTHDHGKALDRLARGRQEAPDWQWRLVRETTAYTVEQPAAEVRQDGGCGNCGGSGLDPRYNGEFVCPDCAHGDAGARQDGAQTEGDRIVAYSSVGSLFCTKCCTGDPDSRSTPVTSADLPDGGLCDECGADVLIPQEPQS